jgi:hypothetical protein
MLSTHVELVPYPGTFIQNVQSRDKEMFYCFLCDNFIYFWTHLYPFFYSVTCWWSYLCDYITITLYLHPVCITVHTLMKNNVTVCLMMMNTNNDPDMSAVCFVCFYIHNHEALFIPFFHYYSQLHNINIFEDDHRNLLMFTSITKTATIFDMFSLAFRWLTSFLYYWTQCHKNKSEFEHIL